MGNIMWHENRLWALTKLTVSQNLRIKKLLGLDSQKNHFVQLNFFSSSNYKNVILQRSIILPTNCMQGFKHLLFVGLNVNISIDTLSSSRGVRQVSALLHFCIMGLDTSQHRIM